MSSSSNDYEHDHSQYEDGFANEMQSPWYPTFGQPLLYYSQVQPFQLWQRFREPEKDKPNCFKKAFRWYTQERVPFKNGRRDSSSNMNEAHLKGFAAWLDEKYNEFLEAGQVEGTKCILTQSSTFEMDKTAISAQSEQPPKKRYKRGKSAWKKRTIYLSAKEKGDVFKKSSQSIEIILKPKELSRPASECCQRAKVSSCCNRSNSNFQCNKTTLHSASVTKPRSRSLTSVVKEKEVRVIPIDAPDYDATNGTRENKTDTSLSDSKNKSERRQGKHRSRNISCQCSRYMQEVVHACSQFEKSEMKTQEPRHCKLNEAEIISPLEYHNTEKKEELVDLGTAGSSARSKITPKYSVQKDEATITARIEKNKSPIFVPVDENVQTSDHSINLNKYLCPEHQKYPLFMKIIRADK